MARIDAERAPVLKALGALSSSMGLTLLHWTYVQDLAAGFRAGTLSPQEERFLVNFGQYIGNNETVFALLSLIMVIDLPLYLLQQKLQMSQQADERWTFARETLLPIGMLLVTMVLLVDAETSQVIAPVILNVLAHLHVSTELQRLCFMLFQGTPVPLDILGGIFGAAMFWPVFQMYEKYIRADLAAMFDAGLQLMQKTIAGTQDSLSSASTATTSAARADQNLAAMDLP